MFGFPRKREYDDLTIIRPDGGICSQIGFVALGETIRRHGGRVKYDLGWYRDCGKDNDGRFVRNWDFPKAFPSIPIEEATCEEIGWLSRKRPYRGVPFGFDAANLYIRGYPPERVRALVERISELREAFQPDLNEDDRRIVCDLTSTCSCAVHVRRGDLANGNDWYGKPASIAYFRRAVRLFAAEFPGTRFAFFSDEPDWVQDVLLPALPRGFEYLVMRTNGSDRGYADLRLIGLCRGVIASAGTLGIFGALLSTGEPLLVMNRKWDYVLDNFPNVIMIKDGFGE